MAAPRNVVTGFNHNVRHKGTVYHVQTEDSGAENAHIITHVFVGGNIIASKKASYADVVGRPNLRELVRAMMEEQHKEVLRNLLAGAYDEAAAAFSNASRSFKPGQIHTGEGEVQMKAEVPGTAPPPQAAPRPAVKPAAPAAPAPKAAAKPPERETIFGEDLISEKSLDEVILSYLAGDSDDKS